MAKAASLGTWLLLLFIVPPVRAQQHPLVDVNGLRGGRHVGSAAPLSHAPRLTAGLGYAYTEDVLDGTDRHHRGFSEVAAGYAPRQWLQLSLRMEARYDGHRSERTGRDRGGAFATDITTRHALSLGDATALGAQLRLHFPASETMVRGLSAVSTELSALATHTLAPHYELSGQLGYRFDRSRESVRAPEQLSAADRLAASLSQFDALVVGALFAFPLGPVTTTLEWSWDVPLGAESPPLSSAPMRVRAGAQLSLAERYVPGVELGVSPSARGVGDLLARVEPRLWAAVSLAVLFEAAPPPAPRFTPPAETVLPAAEPVRIAIRVEDSTGDAVAGARVRLVESERRDVVTTDPDGIAKLTVDPEQSQRIEVTAEGFAPYETELQAAGAPPGLTLRLARALPEGEIKGRVRSLRGGRALRAHVVVRPLDVEVDTDSEGSFAINVPPGEYRLEITAEGHEPQVRPARVERRGVTILVVDLRGSTK